MTWYAKANLNYKTVLDIYNFLKTHITFSTVIAAIIINIIIKILKKSTIYGSKVLLKITRKSNVKSSTKIINHIEHEFNIVRNLKNKDYDTLLELTKTLYHSIVTILVLLSICLITYLLKANLNLSIYIGIMTISCYHVFGCIVNIFCNQNLVHKSLNFDKYKLKIEKKIAYWKQNIKNNQT